jgi:hypothetical protein
MLAHEINWLKAQEKKTGDFELKTPVHLWERQSIKLSRCLLASARTRRAFRAKTLLRRSVPKGPTDSQARARYW